jgi:hypothetical protein
MNMQEFVLNKIKFIIEEDFELIYVLDKDFSNRGWIRAVSASDVIWQTRFSTTSEGFELGNVFSDEPSIHVNYGDSELEKVCSFVETQLHIALKHTA